MALSTGQLVGRAEELRTLERLLDEGDHGRSSAVELVGEPGIGKTRLLAELAGLADGRGWLVLGGAASELERDLPFSAFVDALDEYVEGLAPAHLGSLDEGVRTELAHVFPSLSALATADTVAVQDERYRTHRAVRALLEVLAAADPLLLILDDLHWADPASIELLGALLRRPPAAAVLLALALRPVHAPERLSAALERAERGGAVIRVELGSLSADDASALLGDAPVDAALYEESGGNPFYLEQLARSFERAVDSGRSSSAWAANAGVPSAVAASLREELGLLSPDGRLMLQGAAVAGDPFEPEHAAAAAAFPEAAGLDALDELLKLDLVRGTDVPRRFRFRHPLVRRAVYEATAGAWRLGAHERCAAALAARGASAVERASHVASSARRGDVAAVGVLREAGEAAARLAPASAARWYAEALRLLPETAPADERIDLLVAQARVLTASGHFAESHQALLDALDIVPRGASAVRARLVRTCAAVEANLGRQEHAHARLASELDRLSDDVSPEAVDLRIELAMNALWRARYTDMHESAEFAVAAARRLGDAPVTAAALAVLAFADSMMGAAERADADRLEAAAVVDALSDDELARRLDAAAWLAGAELYLDRYEEADTHATRALDLGRKTGQGDLFLVLVQTLSRVWFVRGKLAEAIDLLDGGIEAARLLGNTQALAWNLFNRSAYALAVGDLDRALATAEESVELTESLKGGFHAAWAGIRLAGALLEKGEAERAIELIHSRAGGEEITLIPGSSRAYCLELLTRCLLALDRLPDAERAATRAQQWAATVHLPLAAAWADRADAAVALRAGDAVGAAQLALRAAATAEADGAPIEAALSRTLAGRALAEGGDAARAASELEQAAVTLDACGATRYRDAAEHELRKLGRHIHRRSTPGYAGSTGLASLTARERQVARLVVDRKTNAQIAAELYVSLKTVETHLRNIFRKMDVTSRVELARAVEHAERHSDEGRLPTSG